MARIVKCQQCGVTNSSSEDMIKDKRGYFHFDCHNLFLKEQELKQKELEELTLLIDTIKDIHDFTVIDKRFYPFLQDCRNGTIRFQGKPIKKYKEGISYSIIKDAYLLAADSIKWAKQNKKFENDLQELKYGLAIVTSKINEVIAKIERKTSMMEAMKNVYEPTSSGIDYKKKESKNNISDFL